MNTAVIGASGFVGRHVVRRLLAGGTRVISIDRNEPRLAQPGERFVMADLFKREEVVHAAAQCGETDAVVWLASAIRHIDTVDERASEDMEIMAEAPLHFLRSLTKQPSALVYLSSIQVYGRPLYSPIDENHPTHPFKVYGVAKLYAEHMLSILARKNGFATAFLRASFIYGPGQHRDNVLIKFMDRITRGEAPVIYGAGNEMRDDIYVDDVARAVEIAIMSRANGVFNIASGKCHTLRDVAETICQFVGRKMAPTHDDRTSSWIDRCFNTNKAWESFGFKVTTSFEEGVKTTWESYQKEIK